MNDTINYLRFLLQEIRLNNNGAQTLRAGCGVEVVRLDINVLAERESGPLALRQAEADAAPGHFRMELDAEHKVLTRPGADLRMSAKCTCIFILKIKKSELIFCYFMNILI